MMKDPRSQRRWLLQLAYQRGKIGNTVATFEEHTTPGYSDAFALGWRESWANPERLIEPHTLIACGCPGCRFERILTVSQEQTP